MGMCIGSSMQGDTLCSRVGVGIGTVGNRVEGMVYAIPRTRPSTARGHPKYLFIYLYIVYGSGEGALKK